MKTPYHFALIGDDVAYSKSGDVFSAIFRHLGVEGRFDIESVGSAELETRVRQLVLDGLRGFAVTIPHKQSVVGFLDDVDPVATTIGAVNSISVDRHRLYGHNTDCFGFALPLRRYRSAIAGKTALVLGHGGAARAVVYALWKDFSVRRFLIAGRSPQRLEAFRDNLAQTLHNAQFETVATSALSQLPARGIGITVNCTPLGGPNHADVLALPDGFDLHPPGVYYDLNYNRPNRNVERAAAQGLEVVDGAAMLVGQAVRSFDIWTGQAVEFQPIFDAVFDAK